MTPKCRARARSPSNPNAPAAGRPAPSPPRQLDRPAKQQQFLGQSGLAGVRMRNDRKAAPKSPLRWPPLCAMQYTDYLDRIGADAIDNDPGEPPMISSRVPATRPIRPIFG